MSGYPGMRDVVYRPESANSRIADASFQVSLSVPYPAPMYGNRVRSTKAATAKPVRGGRAGLSCCRGAVMRGPLLGSGFGLDRGGIIGNRTMPLAPVDGTG